MASPRCARPESVTSPRVIRTEAALSTYYITVTQVITRVDPDIIVPGNPSPLTIFILAGGALVVAPVEIPVGILDVDGGGRP